MIVADTDVLIDALRGRGAHRRVEIELRTGRLATTVISVFELLSGARRPSEREGVETLLAALGHLPIDTNAATEAAAIRRELESVGQTIGNPDILIAGVCRSRGAMLLTRNHAHFSRVPRLSLATLSL